jgi:hypothetical protein
MVGVLALVRTAWTQPGVSDCWHKEWQQSVYHIGVCFGGYGCSSDDVSKLPNEKVVGVSPV